MPSKPTYQDLLVRIAQLEDQLQDKALQQERVYPHSTGPSDKYRDQLQFITILFDTIPNPVFYKNSEGVYLGCNRAFADLILGVPRERIIGRSLYELPDLIPRKLADIYYEQDQTILSKTGEQIYEAKVKCADGVMRDFIFHKATYDNHAGEVAGLLGLMLDVTEKNKIQLKLQESEEKYRSMMESMTDAVYICSHDYRITYMNPQMIEKIGVDATGEHCYKALHGLDSPCPWCVFSKIKDGETVELEVKSPKDGKDYTVTNSPIYHHDGSISKMTIYRDRTRRKKMERELFNAKKLEATGAFAGGLSHDFNNLLCSMLGNILMIKQDKTIGEASSALLLAIENAAQSASRLTKRLMAFTQGEVLKFEKVSSSRLLSQCITKYERATKCTIDTSLQDSLTTVYVDEHLICTAISAILDNGLEAMVDEGKIQVTACNTIIDKESEYVREGLLSNPGTYLQITIVDRGIGIDKEIIPKIFDPYYSTKQRGEKKGLGMGLSRTYSIIREHSGHIVIDSVVKKGTNVTIYLPVNRRQQIVATPVVVPLPKR